MKCCLCGKEIEVKISGWDMGNNAQPLMNGRCCDECNYTKVIPERLKGWKEKGGGKQNGK